MKWEEFWTSLLALFGATMPDVPQGLRIVIPSRALLMIVRAVHVAPVSFRSWAFKMTRSCGLNLVDEIPTKSMYLSLFVSAGPANPNTGALMVEP